MNNQNTLSSILFSSNSNLEFISQLNAALKALIDNDNTFVNENGSAPKIWDCKWLNSTAHSNGYPKGYAVWMNTNTYEQITSYYYRTLEQYITNNATLNAIYATIDQNDSHALNQFFISAANGTASPNVSAIYCLGDISQPVQIRISKFDNNKELPTTSAWEDFFTYSSWDDNFQLMMNAVASAMNNAMNEHMQQYHIENMSSYDLSNTLLQRGYFKKTPFNVNDIQTQWFFDHTYCSQISGFDYIKQWKISPDGSAWCKVWNSGYVEQGGFVDNIMGETFIPVQFMTTYDYPAGVAFYQRNYQTYNNTYSIDTTIQANDRYNVTVTPILKKYSNEPYPLHPININNELVYSSVDVTNMSNAGFSIVNTDLLVERYVKYSWYTSGYKIITDESQLFNGSSVKIASDLSCFTIVDNVIVGFDNDGYTQVIVPDGITSIGKNAFAVKCDNVGSFTLPNTLTSIGQNAFSNCNSLKGIVIPENVVEISSQAFSPCKSLAYVNMGTNVSFIGTSAFCNDEKLGDVTRFDDIDPSHIFNIVGDYAFYNTSMKKLNLSLRSAAINSFWGDYCFAENKQLKEVNILSSSYMSNHMFSGCTSLSSVNFKNNYVSYVYPNVFDGCIALKNIILPSKIWFISEEMFKDCSSLETVEFNDYETAMINLVQKNAFNNCNNLKSLKLPATVNTISCLDDACLSNCSLTSISLYGIDKSQLLNNDGTFIDEINNTGMFRLYHDCLVTCKNGETLQFVYDYTKVLPYVEPMNFMASVDNMTTSNFNVASVAAEQGDFWWYYNAEQLCAQAYDTNIPCLFIYSLLGCNPCQIYAKDIFNNEEFQMWAKKQNFYLCGIECNKQPYYDKSLAFCSDQLRPTALNVAKEYEGQMPNNVVPNALNQVFSIYENMNSNLMTPVLIFYHNNGTNTSAYAYSYHEISRQISDWGLSGVIQCLKSLCLYHFDNNDLANARYVVDAGKAFDINDYNKKQDDGNTNDTIIPIGINDNELLTIDDVNADIVQRLNDFGVLMDNQTDDNGVPYMGGCDLDYIPYIIDSFPDISTYEGSVSSINECINTQYSNIKFKIGENYYKFSLSETNTRMVASVCSQSEILMGLVQWTLIN